MQLELLRISSQRDSTNGILFDMSNNKRKFLCYTLEDEFRPIEKKVMAETRIPAGCYRIILRKVGRIHNKYVERFGSMHKGTLWLQDVPNFQYILIHTGNNDEHTAGCILVGDTQSENISVEDGYIGKSTSAYKRIYPAIAEAIENGEEVWINVVDFDDVK